MKRFAFSLFMMWSGYAIGAHFTAVQEMIYSNSDAITRAVSTVDPNELTDRYDFWHPNDNLTESSTYIEVAPGEYIKADSHSMMRFVINTEGTLFTNNRVYMTADAFGEVEVTTDDGIDAYGWAASSTVSPGNATGNFYRIEADSGESNGDIVIVTFNYNAQISTESIGGSSFSAIIDGGFAGESLLVTLNCADLDDPQPAEIVHSVGRRDTDGQYTDTFIFEAKIGDVIGLHAGVTATAFTGTNPGHSQGQVSANISITISGLGFEPSMADFDRSGKVDLADLAMFASAWLWQEPVNDTCENAKNIELDVHYTGSTSGMTDESVWYRFTPSVSDFYIVSVCQGDDYHLEMYPACGEESFTGTYEDCQFAVWLDSGADYYMEIIGDSWVEGDYNLFVTRGALIPDNDFCGTSEELMGEAWAEGTTIGAMGSDEGSCATGDIHDVWYTYTPEQSGDHVFLLHPAYGPFDGVLTVYDGDVCTPLPSELDCMITDGGEAEIMLSVNAGMSYLVRVGSDGPGAGPFGLEVFYVGGEE